MGISVWQVLILLAVVILIFGTKKLKNVGGDLGSAIKGFKSAVHDSGEDNMQQNKSLQDSDSTAKAESIQTKNT